MPKRQNAKVLGCEDDDMVIAQATSTVVARLKEDVDKENFEKHVVDNQVVEKQVVTNEDVQKHDVEKNLVKSPDILDYMLQTWIAEEDKENSDAGTVLDIVPTDTVNDTDHTCTSTEQDAQIIENDALLTEQQLMSDVEPLTDVQHASIWFMCV
jgi:hypothetical protein